MHIKLVIYLLIFEIVSLTSTRISQGFVFIESVCDTIRNVNDPTIDEYDQWKIICQEMYSSKEDDQDIENRHVVDKREDAIPKIKVGHGRSPGRGPGGGHGNNDRTRPGLLRTTRRTSPTIPELPNTRTETTTLHTVD